MLNKVLLGLSWTCVWSNYWTHCMVFSSCFCIVGSVLKKGICIVDSLEKSITWILINQKVLKFVHTWNVTIVSILSQFSDMKMELTQNYSDTKQFWHIFVLAHFVLTQNSSDKTQIDSNTFWSDTKKSYTNGSGTKQFWHKMILTPFCSDTKWF